MSSTEKVDPNQAAIAEADAEATAASDKFAAVATTAPIGGGATASASFGFLAVMSRNDGRFAMVTPLPPPAGVRILRPIMRESPLPPCHAAPSRRRSCRQAPHV